jgi:hypothetical protein
MVVAKPSKHFLDAITNKTTYIFCHVAQGQQLRCLGMLALTSWAPQQQIETCCHSTQGAKASIS